ncbi:MAG: TolC family protein [Chitinophagaceae bacterium]
MRYTFPIFLLIIFSMFYCSAQAQTKWSLRRAVEYAIANNISVKQANISSQQAALNYFQTRYGIYPTASFSNNWNMSFGRRENPTTGIFENTKALASTFSFTSAFNIFNFYSQRNNIQASKYQQAATEAVEERAKNDIAIRVANGYLLALQAQEQVRVSELQINLTREQLDQTRKRIDAGALPELNAAEIEAQLASDSSALITAQSNTQLQLLQLKAVLQLDAAAPFEVETPEVDRVPLENIGDLQPEVVYQLALTNLPQQRINDLNIKAAEKSRDAARGAMYPSFGGFVGLSTNFFAPLQTSLPGSSPSGEQVTGLYARNGTSTFPVFSPTFTGKTVSKPFFDIWKGFGDQLNQQFGQSAGISLRVPLLNGYQARGAWERSKLTLRGNELQKEVDNQALKQEIYTAYTNAVAALQKNAASRKAVQTAQRSYVLSKKRYDENLLTSFELLTNQNNLFRAQIDLLLARYDYIFKMKLLEFYKGQGMSLE